MRRHQPRFSPLDTCRAGGNLDGARRIGTMEPPDDLLEDESRFTVAADIEEDFSLLEHNRRCLLALRIQPEVVLVGHEKGVRIDSFFGA